MIQIELKVSRAGKELVTLPLEGDSMRIGRAGTNDLAIPEPTVSRHQCEIRRRDEELWLVDCSGKGTRLDGALTREARVAPGSRLEFGSLTVTLQQRPDTAAADSTRSGGETHVLPTTAAAGNLVLVGTLDGGERRVPLSGEVLGIGSDPGNTLAIRDSFVSAFHCRIFRKGDAWRVSDLDSTNGTTLNGVQVTEARLDPGMTLGIGRVRLQVARDEGTPEAPGLGDLIAADPAMHPVFELIRRAAPTDETVLITGESGAGKELVARELHRLSRRTGKPLLPLNCSALTRDLLESELFGHEKGAFTGAQARRIGLFEAADNGTVFLDEIGELPLEMQPKLLRVLENGEIRRVGSNTPHRVDVRMIAATHRSLPERVRSGEFREDLFYRICVVEIRLPPLRERPADIPLLAKAFLTRVNRGAPRTFTDAALQRLAEYTFPGNVRELKHVVTRAAILCEGPVIDAEQLTFAPPTLADRVAESKVYRKGKTLKDVEVETIRQALSSCAGNQRAAAEVLGIARSTLLQKMERHGIASCQSRSAEP